MPDGSDAAGTVRIAAAGDMHCRPALREQALEAFAGIRGEADVLLLAGDLTTHGEPEQAEVLADACRQLDMPILAVLGNHDWHAGRVDELRPILEDGGVTLVDRAHATVDVRGIEVGVAGCKGFVGGFAGSHLPDFGEPSMRRLYRQTSEEVEALGDGLKAIAHCPVRVALLHYAPTSQTLEGEPTGIWTMLGTDRLAAPIAEHEPDLVVHGHAHVGRFEGRVGNVPVYNVSVPVIGRDFWVFELTGVRPTATPIH